MTKQAIIERTVKIINQLPEDKAEELSDFADFLMKRFEEAGISENIHKAVEQSRSFEFLNEDEDLYSEDDLKEKFNG